MYLGGFMSPVICFCDYEDFKKCVPKTHQVMYCYAFFGHEFNCAATIDGMDHIYNGSRQPTFLNDFPKAVEVKGVKLV